MRSLTFSLLFLSVACIGYAAGEKNVLNTNVSPLKLEVDGVELPGGWHVSPEINPDEFTTTGSVVSFASDCDTLTLNLKEWESTDFIIATEKGDSANVRVTRRARNPFDNPSPEMLKISASGLMTREQASFDIKALIYTLDQVHPDIFSVCRQEDLMRAVNKAIESLPDSVSQMDLYRAAAPVVAMIGDGHTNLQFPFNSIFTKELKRLPVYGTINSKKEYVCTTSLDSIMPSGSKVLSINGVAMGDMIDSMLPYVSGEKEHFRLSRVNSSFPALQEMMYHADEYVVEYQPEGSKKVLTVTYPATLWEDIIKRCPNSRVGNKTYQNYSYSIDSLKNVAVMEFNEFSDPAKMKVFADSMFRELKRKNITNLIIDIRDNGGGTSNVGDILLRYISYEPFVQMDKGLVKVTPKTIELMGAEGATPMLRFFEVPQERFIQPLSEEEGHYDGKVYLLTSNHTFSSAGSFAWTFKQCHMGMVIGEETGGMNVSYGDILMYQLPVSKLRCSISFKRFWQLRADENDIHGTIPDMEIAADKALDEAMRQARKNKRRR